MRFKILELVEPLTALPTAPAPGGIDGRSFLFCAFMLAHILGPLGSTDKGQEALGKEFRRVAWREVLILDLIKLRRRVCVAGYPVSCCRTLDRISRCS